jgi:hypothetical protein
VINHEPQRFRFSAQTSMNSDYITEILRELRRLKQLAEGALAQVDDAAFFAVAGPEDNSLAVIVKHMAGNMVSRWTDFLSSDGEKPDRNQDGEFELGAQDTRGHLMGFWERGWSTLEAALTPLTAADLGREVRIRGEPLSVLQAINRQLTHYAYHVGQIVFVAKHHAGTAWRSLSIPRRGSEAFNRAPARYVKDSHSRER